MIMQKLLPLLMCVLLLLGCSDKYDDSALRNDLNDLENRVAKLEDLCKQMNTNISSLQTIVTALQNNVYVTGTTPLMKDGKEIGYTITFSKGNPITIYHGKDGQDGEDGTTPTIGVKKDTDGVYYWTLNGEFIVVDDGKIQAEGKDGTNGTNGTTPQFKIENDYWFVSYDNGTNWTQLGKATGEDGKDADSIKITQDENNVYFELADGTVITISKTGQSADPNVIQFEDALVKAICITNWDTDGDGELSYEEAAAVTTIGTEFNGKGIFAFDELQYFTGMTSIPSSAFSDCSELLSIKLPDNIISINDNAFVRCQSLREIHIPANIESIGYRAFRSCKKLATVIFEKSSQLKTIGGGYHSDIDYGAFSYCTALTSIEIPASVETIEASAFMNCSSLTTITFEKGSQLKTIGGGYYSSSSYSNVYYYGAFCSLKNLVTVDMSACTQVETIDKYAFCNDPELRLFKIGTVTPPSCGDKAFYDINPSSVLKVPSGCADAYKAATEWKRFASITGLDE